MGFLVGSFVNYIILGELFNRVVLDKIEFIVFFVFGIVWFGMRISWCGETLV